MSKVRLNANIDEYIYNELKRVTQEMDISITKYIESILKEEMRRKRYARLKAEFDQMASEDSTQEALKIEEACSNDGLL